MRWLLVCVVVAWQQCLGTIALAQDYSDQVSLVVERVYRNQWNRGKALVTVRNHAAVKLSYVGIRCTFLLAGRPVATGGDLVHNLSPGEAASQDIGGVGYEDFDAARCRISSAIP